MTLHPAKTFCKSFRITMLATRADLGAAAHGIPGGVGPLNLGDYCQDSPPRDI